MPSLKQQEAYYGPAFPSLPGKTTPKLSYGLPFHATIARHLTPGGALAQKARVYVLASGSLARHTDAVTQLEDVLRAAPPINCPAIDAGTRRWSSGGHGQGSQHQGRLAGISIGTIRQHTPLTDVAVVARSMAATSADALITLGAGSVTDAGKIIRLAVAEGALEASAISQLRGKLESGKAQNENMASLVCIPTSLSGGEYNPVAGVTDDSEDATGRGRGTKYQFRIHRDPDLIILDPALCVSTPARVWLSSGVRAIDHCVETLCRPDWIREQHRQKEKGITTFHNQGPGHQGDNSHSSKTDYQDLADTLAYTALPQIVSGLLETNAAALAASSLSGTNADLPASTIVESRMRSQLAARDAISAALAGFPLGGSHAIGHQLGPLGSVGHGETSCVILPAVCRYNTIHGDAGTRRRQRAVARLLTVTPAIREMLALQDRAGEAAQSVATAHAMEAVVAAESAEKAGDSEAGSGLELGDLLARIVADLGLPTTLAAVRVGKDKFEAIAKATMTDKWAATNTVPLRDPEQVLEILRMAQ